MNQKNDTINENRYLNNYEKKIKRIKIGVILVIFIVSVIIVSNAVREIHYNWVEAAIRKYYIRYRDGVISYDTYNSILRNLEYDQYYFRWMCSIVSNSAEVIMNIGFLIIILGFLSITIDKSFNEKMRRISLILATIIFFSMIYLIFEYMLQGEVEVELVYYVWF